MASSPDPAKAERSATARSLSRRRLVLILLVAVLLVVGLTIAFVRWRDSRPEPAPADTALTVTVNGASTEILPYQACELGTPCPEGEIPFIPVDADQDLEISVPSHATPYDYSVLKIYDREAANAQDNYLPRDKKDFAIAGSMGEARLQLVEVKTVMLGIDAAGEETPVAVVWSIRTGDQLN